MRAKSVDDFVSRYSEMRYRQYLAKALVIAREVDDCWIGRCKTELGLGLDCIVFRNYPDTMRIAQLEQRGFRDSEVATNRFGTSRMWLITYGVLFKTIEELRKAEKEGKI